MKVYQIAVRNPADWEIVHELLTRDGTLEDNIPERGIETVDQKDHSPTRSSYKMTEEEAEILRSNPNILYVELDRMYNKDAYDFDRRLVSYGATKTSRYSYQIKNYLNWYGVTPAANAVVTSTLNATLAERSRATAQLVRTQQLRNPWIADRNSDPTYVVYQTPEYYGDGRHVDVVVGDDGCWHGHSEFTNINSSTAPTGYIGGNVLSRTAKCGVLDLVLDAPYYIDPDWFDADAENRLETRWDGTVVPTNSAASDWWGSGSNRSSKFSAAGTVVIPAGYTRETNCGSSSEALGPYVGQHGTPCSSLAFGKTHGWAFNANKWSCNVYGGIYGNEYLDFEEYFDVLKIFHQNKPVNPVYNDKDPTISSNSWGFRVGPNSTGYAYYRGGSAVQFTSDSAMPGFMKYVSTTGDGRMQHMLKPNSLTTAGAELVESGVIFLAAAGNDSQKIVLPDHPDYDNYYHSDNTNPGLENTTIYELDNSPAYKSTQRRGFPQQIGLTESGEYPVISIGALDDVFNSGKERKASYSNCGNGVDCYAVADGTIAAATANYTAYFVGRYDFKQENGAILSNDRYFNGTSSACPVAAGFLATRLQYNRGWTWQDVREYIQNLTPQSSDDFYIGTEAASINATEWSDLYNIQGSDPIVLYDDSAGVHNHYYFRASNVLMKNLKVYK